MAVPKKNFFIKKRTDVLIMSLSDSLVMECPNCGAEKKTTPCLS